MAEAMESSKACRFCGEQILAVAIKCKHCGSNLNVTADGAVPAGKPGEAIGVVMLVLPICAAVLIWFWIGSMNLLQSPLSTLQGVTAVTVLLTAVLGAVEASQLGFGTSEKKESGSGAWFAFIALFWIVGFPAYLFQRSRHGARNLLVGGILSTLVFTAVAGLMYYALEAKMAEVREMLNRFGR